MKDSFCRRRATTTRERRADGMGEPKYILAKLHGRIIEVFGSVSAFNKAMGWKSTATAGNKLNLKSSWRWDEVVKTCKLLNIPIGEAETYIFFG